MIIETPRYSTKQNWIGSTYWQKHEKGDTLYFTLFTKSNQQQGEDVTAQYPDRRKTSKRKETRVTDFP